MCERGYPQKVRRRIASSRSKALANTAFPKAMPRALRFWSMSPPGSNAITLTCSLAALLNSQPMGFYATSQLVRDAQEHGVEVRPVDVNRSNWDCSLGRRSAPNGAFASASCVDARRYSDDACCSSRLSPDRRLLRGMGEEHRKRSRSRLRFCPRSLAAHRSAAEGAAKACPRRRFQFARAQPPRCAMGREGASEGRRQGRSAAVRARQHAEA